MPAIAFEQQDSSSSEDLVERWDTTTAIQGLSSKSPALNSVFYADFCQYPQSALIDFIPTPVPGSIGLRIDGGNNTADLYLTLQAIAEAIASRNCVSVYFEILTLDHYDFDTLVENIWLAFPNFCLDGRKVVVCELQEAKAATGFAGKFLPGGELRHFSPADKAKALAWLAQRPDGKTNSGFKA